jgi:hypothetical protein
MGTRSGDLDPGVVLHLLRSGMTPDAAYAWTRKWALFNQMAADHGGYRIS